MLPFPFLGDLPAPGVQPVFLASPALAGRFFTTAPLGNGHYKTTVWLHLPYAFPGFTLTPSL